jgi:acid phosphatase family membrane protein YuiD
MELLIQYKIFLIPIVVGTVVQIIKFALYSIKNGWNIRYVMTHGHMPSAHTAFVTSLITSVALFDDDGLKSGAFAVAVILAVIVIDDAVRLRMYMGDQGRYLNMLIRQLNINEEQFPRLKERMGHKVKEVIVGGILGIIFTFILANLLN